MTTTNVAGLGFDANTRKYPCAPKDLGKNDFITVPVFGADGTVIGYQQIAAAPKPNGGNIESGMPQVAIVTTNKAPGKVTASTKITLSTATAGAEIYYTTDGTTPTKTNGTKATGEITISASTTYTARAFKDGMKPSEIATFKYTV